MAAERKYEVSKLDIFGNLTVLSGDSFYPINEKTGKKTNTRCVKVQCDCGYIFNTSIALLAKGKVTSCKYTKAHYEITGESLGTHKHMMEKIKKEKENKVLADKEREDVAKEMSSVALFVWAISIIVLGGFCLYILLK